MRLLPTLSLMALMTLVPTGLSLPSEPVSLSKFTPRIENLPSSCQEAYNAPISGCTREDFPKERNPNINNCSGACVDGLIDIVALVNEKCAAVRVPRDSIIGVALVGDLLPKLCGGVVVVTEGPSVVMSTEGGARTSAASSVETTQRSETSETAGSQSSQSSGATPSTTQSSTLSTSTAPPPTTTSPSLTLDTSTPPPPPPPSETSSNQEANTGGSPFDIMLADTSSAPRTRQRLPRIAIVGLAVCAVLGMR